MLGVAGFDFEFEYADDAAYELARRLLRHLRWRPIDQIRARAVAGA